MSEHESTATTRLLTESERAAMFAAHAPVDRNLKHGGGRAPVPPKAVAWILAIFVVLGLGGAALEHFFGGFGVTSATTTKFLPSNANLTPVGSLNTLSVDQLMDLKEIDNATAPGFTLRTQRDHLWKLHRSDGKVIVLAFENSTCNDICPVLGAEIKQAQTLLGKDQDHVEFAIVNTDPRDLSMSANPTALRVPGLSHASNVVFLTGSLSSLDAVWTSYGVRIKVGAKPGEVTHNNVLFFIAPSGQLEAQATPFANVNSNGVFFLKDNLISRFAKGIATTADSLVK
jgi:protein SCO1/2